MEGPIWIPGMSLEEYYQDTIEYLNHKYHSYRTSFEDVPMSAEDRALLAQAQEYASNPPAGDGHNRWVS